MTKGRIEPATPGQIAMFGHIAARLRQVMDERDWKVRDLNVAMDRAETQSDPYVWLAAKGAPSPKMRDRLAKVLKIPVADLMPRDDSTVPMKAERVPRAAPPPRAETIAPPHPPSRDVLNFSINHEGQARIRLDVTMPALKGAGLLRILMDAGLTLGAAEDPPLRSMGHESAHRETDSP
jgi:hypothetical protein